MGVEIWEGPKTERLIGAIKEVRDAILGERTGIVYGFHIDSTESDPEDCITYLEDAVGMVPAKMNYGTGKFDYGSWEHAFFMPRPCMLNFDGSVAYYLNPNDYSKKADGTASDVADLNFAGNAMMEWGQNGKKIWYKIVPDATPTSASVYIADYPADEDFRAWSFINNQGVMVDHFYTPIYNGHLDSSNRMRSISGQAYTKSLTAANERTYCRNNSSLPIWDTEVFCDVILINLLLYLMSKSLDTQTAFGQGLTTSGSQAVNEGFSTGVHNAKGLFFGTSSGAAATYTNAVKVFGMENWWGFTWRRIGGLVNVSGTEKYKLTRGTGDGSTATDYVVSATAADYGGYLTGGTLPSASGTYIGSQTFSKWAYTPTTVQSSSALYYCDGLWTNNGQVEYALRGGSSYNTAPCGAGALGLSSAAAAALWHIAAAPSCKPLS